MENKNNNNNNNFFDIENNEIQNNQQQTNSNKNEIDFDLTPNNQNQNILPSINNTLNDISEISKLNNTNNTINNTNNNNNNNNSGVNINTLDINKKYNECSNPLEFFIISLCKNMNISIKQSIALLSNNRKYLKILCYKGIKKNFEKVIFWLNDVLNNINLLINLLKSDSENNNKNILMTYATIGIGLNTKNFEVCEYTIKILSYLIIEIGDNNNNFDWIKNEGFNYFNFALFKYLNIKRSIIQCLFFFIKNNFNEFINFLLNRNEIDFLFEIIPFLNDDEYINVFIDNFINNFINTVINNNNNNNFIENNNNLIENNNNLIENNNNLIENNNNLIENNNNLIENNNNNNKIKPPIILNILTYIWIFHSSKISSNKSSLILKYLKYYIRNTVSLNNLNINEMTSISNMFYLLDNLAKIKDQNGPIIYKSLVFLLLEEYNELPKREFLLNNFQNFFYYNLNVPIDILLNPYLKFLNNNIENNNNNNNYDLIDFNFFSVIIGHPRFSAEMAEKLIQFCLKVSIENYYFLKLAIRTMDLIFSVKIIEKDEFVFEKCMKILVDYIKNSIRKFKKNIIVKNKKFNNNNNKSNNVILEMTYDIMLEKYEYVNVNVYDDIVDALDCFRKEKGKFCNALLGLLWFYDDNDDVMLRLEEKYTKKAIIINNNKNNNNNNNNNNVSNILNTTSNNTKNISIISINKTNENNNNNKKLNKRSLSKSKLTVNNTISNKYSFIINIDEEENREKIAIEAIYSKYKNLLKIIYKKIQIENGLASKASILKYFREKKINNNEITLDELSLCVKNCFKININEFNYLQFKNLIIYISYIINIKKKFSYSMSECFYYFMNRLNEIEKNNINKDNNKYLKIINFLRNNLDKEKGILNNNISLPPGFKIVLKTDIKYVQNFPKILNSNFMENYRMCYEILNEIIEKITNSCILENKVEIIKYYDIEIDYNLLKNWSNVIYLNYAKIFNEKYFESFKNNNNNNNNFNVGIEICSIMENICREISKNLGNFSQFLIEKEQKQKLINEKKIEKKKENERKKRQNEIKEQIEKYKKEKEEKKEKENEEKLNEEKEKKKLMKKYLEENKKKNKKILEEINEKKKLKIEEEEKKNLLLKEKEKEQNIKKKEEKKLFFSNQKLKLKEEFQQLKNKNELFSKKKIENDPYNQKLPNVKNQFTKDLKFVEFDKNLIYNLENIINSNNNISNTLKKYDEHLKTIFDIFHINKINLNNDCLFLNEFKEFLINFFILNVLINNEQMNFIFKRISNKNNNNYFNFFNFKTSFLLLIIFAYKNNNNLNINENDIKNLNETKINKFFDYLNFSFPFDRKKIEDFINKNKIMSTKEFYEKQKQLKKEILPYFKGNYLLRPKSQNKIRIKNEINKEISIKRDLSKDAIVKINNNNNNINSRQNSIKLKREEDKSVQEVFKELSSVNDNTTLSNLINNKNNNNNSNVENSKNKEDLNNDDINYSVNTSNSNRKIESNLMKIKTADGKEENWNVQN